MLPEMWQVSFFFHDRTSASCWVIYVDDFKMAGPN